MQLEFAIFCEAAEVSDVGIIDMLRGGFDMVSTTVFPAALPRMVIVVRVLCEPDEIDREHALISQFIDPNGHVLPPTLTVPFTTPPYPGNPNRKNRNTLKLDYWPMQFAEAGNYTFRFLVDGVQIGESTLEVRPMGKKV